MGVKILLINDHAQLNGGGDAVLHFEFKYLKSIGYDVFLMSFGIEDYFDGENIVIGTSSYNFINKYRKFGFAKSLELKIKEVLINVNPSVIHLHLLSKFPLVVYNVINKFNIPVIQTIHGPNLFCSTSWGGFKNSKSCDLGIGLKCVSNNCTSPFNAFLYWQLQIRYFSFLNNKVDIFHCPSKDIFRKLSNLGFKKVIYFPLGIDDCFTEPYSLIEKSRPTLIFVGALAIQKGVLILLEALRIVIKDLPNVLLKIAGRGNLENKMKSLVKEYDLKNNVEFCGFVPHSEIKDFYLSGDVFVLPSIWQEQFGLVGPEAMSCGLACIGTNVGGIPEWLADGESGFLVEPQNPIDLAEKIIFLFNNPELIKSFGKRGSELALERFGPSNYRTNLLNMINSFVSEKA